MACHKCGKLGHFERECRSGSREPEKPKSGKMCYICGSPDHFKRECPKKGETGGRQGVAFVAGEGAETGRWIVDTGASQHMTGVKSSFSTLEMLQPGTRAIKFGNKGFLEVAGVGTVELRCETPEGEQVILLRKVAYVPGVAENLFSVKKATAVGAEVVFHGKVCEVSMDGEVVLRAEKNAEGMPVVCQPKTTWEDTCLLVREAESPVLWHRRLGHAGYESLAKMVEGDSVRGVGVKAEAFWSKRTSVCEPCIIGKQTREPSPKESDSKDSKEPLELVHMDVCGPMPVTSKGGSRYLATFLDDYSKLSVVQPAIKRKSDALAEVHGRGDAVLVGERSVGACQKTGGGEAGSHEKQPEGYEQGGPNVVCHLKRTLYGLRQAPRAWYTRLEEELGNFEFVASSADAALFSGVVDGERVYLIVWVDDILVAARGAERIAKVKAHLAEKYDVRDLGEATYFLGMELARDRVARTLKLTQKKLTGELLGRHGLAGARARSVPLGAGKKLTREGEPLDTARFHYSELIGSLLYLSVCTRPDIAHAVGSLARYTSAPTEAHWAAALGVVRYLAGTAEAGMTFGGSGEVFKAFCDADYAGDVDTKRLRRGTSS
ncbi:hypothetical protein KFL_016370010 [Klebsormidium nitens]|uniref:CCHC-type domain-containing protein n=1 Tax=Klebsormidium nitens TaxID=105231 RepID=A0A1Y1IS99_KLENI|nr:hypothetical protein KFL_016370010 [Klebsormidium nitens]|eukprot:GAQ93544.1 hypothetical protein KFL_016370010 [Klebsormidium nitens]